MYILKFENMECWIAPWNGDPGRTLVRRSARQFDSKEQAELFRKRCLKENCHRKFNLVLEEV